MIKIKWFSGLPLGLFAGILFTLFSGCEKEEVVTAPQETGTVTDADGNVYKTVKIGNQWWMAENLKVKRYRNGDLISQAQAAETWMDSVGSYCLYLNDSVSPGLLYNGYAAGDQRNIAPDGWHIPSDAEWKQMEVFLGMNGADSDKPGWRGSHEGEKLRIASPQGWTRFGEVWSTNESGFSALAGGCRLNNGIWGNPGLFATGFWWSSTGLQNKEIWYRHLDYKNADVFRSHVSRHYGFSVRCVKD